MALLPQSSLPTFHSRDFGWREAGRTLVGEVSTIQRTTQRLFGQVFDDAIDQGFAIVSHRTGKTLTFVVDKIDRNSEGEIQGWWLKPLNSILQFKVFVIND